MLGFVDNTTNAQHNKFGIINATGEDSSKVRTRTVPYFFIAPPTSNPPITGTENWTTNDLMVTHQVEVGQAVTINLPGGTTQNIQYNSMFRLIIPATSTATIVPATGSFIAGPDGTPGASTTLEGPLTVEYMLMPGAREGQTNALADTWYPMSGISESDSVNEIMLPGTTLTTQTYVIDNSWHGKVYNTSARPTISFPSSITKNPFFFWLRVHGTGNATIQNNENGGFIWDYSMDLKSAWNQFVGYLTPGFYWFWRDPTSAEAGTFYMQNHTQTVPNAQRSTWRVTSSGSTVIQIDESQFNNSLIVFDSSASTGFLGVSFPTNVNVPNVPYGTIISLCVQGPKGFSGKQLQLEPQGIPIMDPNSGVVVSNPGVVTISTLGTVRFVCGNLADILSPPVKCWIPMHGASIPTEVSSINDLNDVALDGGETTDHMLVHNGAGNFVNSPLTTALNNKLSIGQLSDVADGINTTNGNVLHFNVSNEVIASSGANYASNWINISDLANVNAPSPADDDLMVWEAGATNRWINRPMSFYNGLLTFTGLSDTSGTTGATGNILFWSAGIVNNATLSTIASDVTYGLSLGDLNDCTTTGASDGHALLYDSTGGDYVSREISINDLENSSKDANDNLALFSNVTYGSNSDGNSFLFNDYGFNLTNAGASSLYNTIVGRDIGLNTPTSFTGSQRMLYHTCIGYNSAQDFNLSGGNSVVAIGRKALGTLSSSGTYSHIGSLCTAIGGNNYVNDPIGGTPPTSYLYRVAMVGSANQVNSANTTATRYTTIIGVANNASDSTYTSLIGGQNIIGTGNSYITSIGGSNSIGNTNTYVDNIGSSNSIGASGTGNQIVGPLNTIGSTTAGIGIFGGGNTITGNSNFIDILGNQITVGNASNRILAMGNNYTVPGGVNNRWVLRWGGNFLTTASTTGSSALQMNNTTGEITRVSCMQELKTDIQDMTETIVDKALAVPVRTFLPSDDPTYPRRTAGLIAQECEAVGFTEILNYDKTFPEGAWDDYEAQHEAYRTAMEAYAMDPENIERPVKPVINEPEPIGEELSGLNNAGLSAVNLYLLKLLFQNGANGGIYPDKVYLQNPTGVSGKSVDTRIDSNGQIGPRNSGIDQKNTIEDLTLQEAKDVCHNINPRKYQYNDIPGETYMGLIQEELDTLGSTYPLIGSLAPVSPARSVDYAKITVALLKVVQDLESRLYALENP